MSFFVIFLNSEFHSQNLSNSFISELKKIEVSKIDTILESYQEKNKYKYLNLIPAVSYDLMNNSFSIGFSLSNLSNYLQQNQRNKIELAKLESTLNENLNRKLDQIELLIEQFNFDYKIFENELKLWEIDKDLFFISEGKYKNSEITTEDFLKIKKTFISTRNNLISKLYKLELQAIILQKKTKNDSFRESLLVLSNLIQ